MNCSVFSRRFLKFAAVAALTTTLSNSASAATDLLALFINGPGQVHVGATNLVTLTVSNLGDPLASGDYTCEIVLTDDLIIDPLDTIIHTFQSSFIGQQGMLVTVPLTMSEGKHAWGMRILDYPGETVLTNNVALGDACNVYRTDLQLDDPTPIEAFVRVGDDEAPTVQATINNIGTVGSIVVVTIETLIPTPWLIIDEPSSFAVGGQPGNDVEFRFDHTGLLPGSYSTTVRFQNITLIDDYEDLEIKLTVGQAIFTPGHFIVGQIATPDDEDILNFYAVEGMRLRLRLRTPSGDIKPRISIIDPNGFVEEVMKFKHTGEKRIKKVHKLKMSGEYSLKIESAPDTSGPYNFFTKRKLPKKARPRTVKVTNPGGGGTQEIPVLVLPHAKLEFVADPNGKFGGPMTVGFNTPSGQVFDISANSTAGPNGEFVVEDVDLGDGLGAFKIKIGNFGANPKAKVVVHVLPFQPKRGKGKLYLK